MMFAKVRQANFMASDVGFANDVRLANDVCLTAHWANIASLGETQWSNIILSEVKNIISP
ncbi:MAG: hypothetical protein IIX69_08100, partial [Clostridia bacterium]|nr:hypothetical protein [Clostridia bacterium]